MSSSNNNFNNNAPMSDQELEQRLAKLKENGVASIPTSDQDLAIHFSKVFGHSPAATHLSPPLNNPHHLQNSSQPYGSDNNHQERQLDSKQGSTPYRRSSSSYFIPQSSELGQEE
ncbi:hypothetical protein BGZ76_008951, partial [Entomortierella beljakovae]